MSVLADEVRDIDDRERVAAKDQNFVAYREAAQRLARPQHRHRAFQAAEVEFGWTPWHQRVTRDVASFTMTFAERLNAMQPDLIADVLLYATEAGGKTVPALPGYGCTCAASKEHSAQSYDARFQLRDALHPGERRRVGMIFLTPEGAEAMRSAKRFYLREGRFIGEATVVADPA